MFHISIDFDLFQCAELGFRGGRIIPRGYRPHGRGTIMINELDCPHEEQIAWTACQSPDGYYEFPCPTEPSHRFTECRFSEYNYCSHVQDIYIQCGMFMLCLLY